MYNCYTYCVGIVSMVTHTGVMQLPDWTINGLEILITIGFMTIPNSLVSHGVALNGCIYIIIRPNMIV